MTRYYTNEHQNNIKKLSRILKGKRKTNKAEIIITTLSAFILLWFVASYVNCMTNIDNHTYNYAWWNVIAFIKYFI